MPSDSNAPAKGKVLLFINHGDAQPYFSFTTQTTVHLPGILHQLSGQFSPIQKRNSRIYVFEDETWEVKGRFNQAIKDESPAPWYMASDNTPILTLLAVSVIIIIFVFSS